MSFSELEPSLARLDMAAVYRWLSTTSSARGLDATQALLGANPEPHRHLAGLVHFEPSTKVREAVAVASWGLGRTATNEVVHFLRGTAAAVIVRGALVAGAGAADALAAEIAEPGRLVVAAELGELPLLALAADVAHRHPGGLVVTTGDLGGLLGIASTDHGTARTVLDPAAIAANGADVGSTFAHELSHIVDPHRGRRATVVADETFANHLGPALLRANPATVADARPLVDAAHDAAGPALPDDDWAGPDTFDGFWWWMTQELDDADDRMVIVTESSNRRRPAGREHRHDPPGVNSNGGLRHGRI